MDNAVIEQLIQLVKENDPSYYRQLRVNFSAFLWIFSEILVKFSAFLCISIKENDPSYYRQLEEALLALFHQVKCTKIY